MAGDKSFPPILIKTYYVAMILSMAGLCCRQYIISVENADLKGSNGYLAEKISHMGEDLNRWKADAKALETDNARLRKLVFDYENRPPERWVIDNVKPIGKSR